METDGGTSLETWAKETIVRRWPRAEIETIVTLRGDASSRRFWRVRISGPGTSDAPPSAILVDAGSDDFPRYLHALNRIPRTLQEPPWINVHRFLTSIGVAVPVLYDFAPAQRAMLVEDVGNLALRDAARAHGADVADLFRLAVEELIRMHVEGTRKIDDRCVARAIEYDGRLFEWEMKEFIEIALPTVAPAAKDSAIRPELASLAARLDRFPRIFSHRDYHGHNLFIQAGPRIRVIDFQDALMAPAAQDLAVLLTTRDTGNVVTPAIEERLLDFYRVGLARRGSSDFAGEDFLTGYRLAVLQHALKMIGRFELFERNGKSGYRTFIPHCLGQARRMLSKMRREFPQLAEALGA
jgi:N-acetylmuramate 1-kinase